MRERLGDPRAVPDFHCALRPDMPSPKTPGSSTSTVPDSDVDIGLRRVLTGSALPKPLQSVSRRVSISWLPRFTHLLRPAKLLAPCTDPTGFPAIGDFYYQASNGSVALPVAGYNYNSDWTPLLVGLAPTERQLGSLHSIF